MSDARESAVGLRVVAHACAPASVLELFRGLPSSAVGDAMHRMTGTTGLRPMHNGAPLLGSALTVRVRAGDNLMIYRALQLMQPGEVLAIDGDGDTSRALVGEIVVALARSRGAGGMVIDGAVRDCEALAASDFPVYARGVSLKGPYKNGPGEIGVPASIGGITVRSGDILVGDADGVVCVPAEQAVAVAAAARAVIAHEATLLADIQAGRYDDAWLAAALARAGMQV